MTPLSSHQGEVSELVILDNRLQQATISCRSCLPGVDGADLLFKIALTPSSDPASWRLLTPGRLEQTGTATTRLQAAPLEVSFDRVRVSLAWFGSGWVVDATADGSLRLAPEVALESMQGLEQPGALRFEALDLVRLRRKPPQLELRLESPVRLDLLGGAFHCLLREVLLRFTEGVELVCPRTEFVFDRSFPVEVAVEPGMLSVRIQSEKAGFYIPSPLRIEARLGSHARFLGTVRGGGSRLEARGLFIASGHLGSDAFLIFSSQARDPAGLPLLIELHTALRVEVPLFPGVVHRVLRPGSA